MTGIERRQGSDRTIHSFRSSIILVEPVPSAHLPEAGVSKTIRKKASCAAKQYKPGGGKSGRKPITCPAVRSRPDLYDIKAALVGGVPP